MLAAAQHCPWVQRYLERRMRKPKPQELTLGPEGRASSRSSELFSYSSPLLCSPLRRAFIYRSDCATSAAADFVKKSPDVSKHVSLLTASMAAQHHQRELQQQQQLAIAKVSRNFYAMQDKTSCSASKAACIYNASRRSTKHGCQPHYYEGAHVASSDTLDKHY